MHPNHKKSFVFINFHTEFSSKGNNDISMDTRACFNSLVSYHRTFSTELGSTLKINDICSNTYKIIIYFDEYGEENNCCLMSTTELSEWVEDMKRFAEFEYEFKENKHYKNSTILELKFVDRPFAEHFLVLEFIKHSYEFPFNYSSYQAVKMRNIINKDELLVNIHNMIFCCNLDFKEIACSDHVLFTYQNVYMGERRKNNTIKINSSHYYPVVYLPDAEEIKNRCAATNRLTNIFNPSLLGIKNINNYNVIGQCVYYIGKDIQNKNSSSILNAVYELSKNFKYYDNLANGVKSRYFDEYFNIAKCKERLDCYIETYDKIKDYGKCQSE